ncbi:hypothetical protein EDD18DRAFT_1084378, partial [Armillaria luteobubalina]
GDLYCASCCDSDRPLYCCLSYYEGFLYCNKCLVHHHYGNPFHHIQEWNRHCFIKNTLHMLGVHLALGHDEGDACPCTISSVLQVINVDSIHQLTVNYCNCRKALPCWQQLLHAHLFPSTVMEPQIVATFCSLEVFQLLSFMSKVMGYKFYHILARLMDNTGTTTPTIMSAWMHMIREWRHLKLLKPILQSGTLVVQCPACPWPGLNMPEGWQSDPENPCVHTFFLAINANFCLVQFHASNGQKDPSLNQGAAFLIEQEVFHRHITKYGHRLPHDLSNCSQHNTVKSVTRHQGQGLATSGTVTVDCAWHNCKNPSSVPILDVGEEQVQMDYFFLHRLLHSSPPQIVVSYDITCQWSKKLWEQIGIYPTDLMPAQGPSDITFLVLKFHLPTYIPCCHAWFSFWKTPNIGQTDGKAPEHGWGNTNKLAGSMKNMGPGSYLDTIDDHLGDFNWWKSTLLGEHSLAVSHHLHT